MGVRLRMDLFVNAYSINQDGWEELATQRPQWHNSVYKAVTA